MTHLEPSIFSIPVVKESCVKAIVPYQSGAHSRSGCVTVGCYYDNGKGKVVRVLRDGYSLPGLGDTK